MALTTLDGGFVVPIGPGYATSQGAFTTSNVTMDAANEATIYIGYIQTSDGASHTINTTGSSSLGWRTGTSTFANAGTTVKVGLSTVLATAGPPGRATNVADVITFNVSKSMTGGGGGITSAAWQTHVPDTGTQTIANGDLVAFCVQMTARGGVDSVLSEFMNNNIAHRPFVTGYTGGSYALTAGGPNAIITFSDGALGFFQGSDVCSTISSNLIWNSGSATKEYGQLYKIPFPMKIYGMYAWLSPDADFDFVLYSDPLGTPVAEKTISVDANTVAGATLRKISVAFASPYTTTADQLICAVLKPGGTDITTKFRTLASATHRITEAYGADGYGVSRASGAFSDKNSGLDHFWIGLLVGAFDDGAGGSGPAGKLISFQRGSPY
jgi:hypothetical protein